MCYTGVSLSSGSYQLPISQTSFLTHLRENTKLAFVSQIEESREPYISQTQAMLNLLKDKNAQSIPSRVTNMLEAAKQFVASITLRLSVKKIVKLLLRA